MTPKDPTEEEGREEVEPERPPIHVVDKRISAGGTSAPSRPAAAREASQPEKEQAGGGQETTERIWTPEPPPSEPSEAAADRDAMTQDEARRVAQQIIDTPSAEWIVNVAVTLANVAGAKLDAGRLDDAKVAIDALAGLVKSSGEQLAGAEAPLRQTLAQLQMAYAKEKESGVV